jgi:nucleoside-diphosphate-sugar epimerase
VRALITGAGGFAGGHLAAHCRASGDDVIEASRRSGTDLRDAGAARAAVEHARPDVVYHLAARAHVGESWEDPASFLRDNLGMALNVLEAVRAEAPRATVVAVSSGASARPPPCPSPRTRRSARRTRTRSPRRPRTCWPGSTRTPTACA